MRPPRDCPLAIVTGAPGAGKSTAARALLQLPREYLVFDADSLLPDLSALVGHSLRKAAELWPPHRRLWLTVARMIEQNGRQTVLFIPIDPQELAAALPDDWHGAVAWCLLDCDNPTRRARLLARGWEDRAITEALDDARALRDVIPFTIDTGRLIPEAVAATIDRGLRGGDNSVGALAALGKIGADVL